MNMCILDAALVSVLAYVAFTSVGMLWLWIACARGDDK